MLKFIYGIDSKKAAQSWELKMQLTIETFLANFTFLSTSSFSLHILICLLKVIEK